MFFPANSGKPVYVANLLLHCVHIIIYLPETDKYVIRLKHQDRNALFATKRRSREPIYDSGYLSYFLAPYTTNLC